MNTRTLLNQYFDDLKLLLYADQSNFDGSRMIPKAARNPHGIGKQHAMWMIEEVLANEHTWPSDKLNRWIGYLQCLLVLNRIRTLDELREEMTAQVIHEMNREKTDG